MILGARNVCWTGATRHRSERRWGRERMILQYQFAGMVTRLLGPHPDTETQTWWRDATAEDVSASGCAQPHRHDARDGSSPKNTEPKQGTNP